MILKCSRRLTFSPVLLVLCLCKILTFTKLVTGENSMYLGNTSGYSYDNVYNSGQFSPYEKQTRINQNNSPVFDKTLASSNPTYNYKNNYINNQDNVTHRLDGTGLGIPHNYKNYNDQFIKTVGLKFNRDNSFCPNGNCDYLNQNSQPPTNLRRRKRPRSINGRTKYPNLGFYNRVQDGQSYAHPYYEASARNNGRQYDRDTNRNSDKYNARDYTNDPRQAVVKFNYDTSPQRGFDIYNNYLQNRYTYGRPKISMDPYNRDPYNIYPYGRSITSTDPYNRDSRKGSPYVRSKTSTELYYRDPQNRDSYGRPTTSIIPYPRELQNGDSHSYSTTSMVPYYSSSQNRYPYTRSTISTDPYYRNPQSRYPHVRYTTDTDPYNRVSRNLDSYVHSTISTDLHNRDPLNRYPYSRSTISTDSYNRESRDKDLYGSFTTNTVPHHLNSQKTDTHIDSMLDTDPYKDTRYSVKSRCNGAQPLHSKIRNNTRTGNISREALDYSDKSTEEYFNRENRQSFVQMYEDEKNLTKDEKIDYFFSTTVIDDTCPCDFYRSIQVPENYNVCLYLHNYRRCAENIRPLKWSYELEGISKSYLRLNYIKLKENFAAEEGVNNDEHDTPEYKNKEYDYIGLKNHGMGDHVKIFVDPHKKITTSPYDYIIQNIAYEIQSKGIKSLQELLSYDKVISTYFNHWSDKSKIKLMDYFCAKEDMGWYVEEDMPRNADVNSPEYNRYPPDVYNHLTQVMWAGTEYVGCAIETNDNRSAIFGVCHYYPSGNMYKERYYMEPPNIPTYRSFE